MCPKSPSQSQRRVDASGSSSMRGSQTNANLSSAAGDGRATSCAVLARPEAVLAELPNEGIVVTELPGGALCCTCWRSQQTGKSCEHTWMIEIYRTGGAVSAYHERESLTLRGPRAKGKVRIPLKVEAGAGKLPPDESIMKQVLVMAKRMEEALPAREDLQLCSSPSEGHLTRATSSGRPSNIRPLFPHRSTRRSEVASKASRASASRNSNQSSGSVKPLFSAKTGRKTQERVSDLSLQTASGVRQLEESRRVHRQSSKLVQQRFTRHTPGTHGSDTLPVSSKQGGDIVAAEDRVSEAKTLTFEVLRLANLADVEFIGSTFVQGGFKHWMDPAYQFRADDCEVMDEVLNQWSVLKNSGVLFCPVFFHRWARELKKWGPHATWEELQTMNRMLWGENSKYGVLRACRARMPDDISFAFLHNVREMHWVLVRFRLRPHVSVQVVDSLDCSEMFMPDKESLGLMLALAVHLHGSVSYPKALHELQVTREVYASTRIQADTVSCGFWMIFAAAAESIGFDILHMCSAAKQLGLWQVKCQLILVLDARWKEDCDRPLLKTSDEWKASPAFRSFEQVIRGLFEGKLLLPGHGVTGHELESSPSDLAERPPKRRRVDNKKDEVDRDRGDDVNVIIDASSFPNRLTFWERAYSSDSSGSVSEVLATTLSCTPEPKPPKKKPWSEWIDTRGWKWDMCDAGRLERGERFTDATIWSWFRTYVQEWWNNARFVALNSFTHTKMKSLGVLHNSSTSGRRWKQFEAYVNQSSNFFWQRPHELVRLAMLVHDAASEHWWIVFADLQMKHIRIYDSWPRRASARANQQGVYEESFMAMRLFLTVGMNLEQGYFDDWRMLGPPSDQPMQRNNIDCGVYTAATIYALSSSAEDVCKRVAALIPSFRMEMKRRLQECTLDGQVYDGEYLVELRRRVLADAACISDSAGREVLDANFVEFDGVDGVDSSGGHHSSAAAVIPARSTGELGQDGAASSISEEPIAAAVVSAPRSISVGRPHGVLVDGTAATPFGVLPASNTMPKSRKRAANLRSGDDLLAGSTVPQACRRSTRQRKPVKHAGEADAGVVEKLVSDAERIGDANDGRVWHNFSKTGRGGRWTTVVVPRIEGNEDKGPV